jgi:hypothetical protein
LLSLGPSTSALTSWLRHVVLRLAATLIGQAVGDRLDVPQDRVHLLRSALVLGIEGAEEAHRELEHVLGS